jgi:SAM-dependent methyltransferase
VGLVGGRLGYRLLRALSPGGASSEKYCDGSAYHGRSKLQVFFGPELLGALAGLTVVDYGCGGGQTTIELAQRGCAKVIGLDVQLDLLESARAAAEAAGVSANCEFTSIPPSAADVVVSLDSFEHFADPAATLAHMKSMLKPGGYVLAEFGPTWYHPLGGHLFSVFPWAHLVFTEKALIRWRSDFKTDGATRFHEVAGGLNGLTIGRWERIVRASGMAITYYELRPIRGTARFHNRLTREFLTAVVVCRLEKR